MTSAAGKAHGAGLLPEQPRDGAVDDPVDADAPTRTGTHAPEAPAPLDSPANDVGQIAPARLPAPLQYRDPARYDILGEHGRGGLGRVFRARDREMGRDVALKELLNRGASSELRFFREALITARLEHPGIVPVHEAGRWPDGTPFYAMKLVAGRPLKVLFENARTVEARLALLPHILAVADAIAYAHDRKIIHRDLKPANVIVGEFGETVVIDWGLAKDISPEAEDDEPSEAGPYRTAAPTPGVTVAGSVLGTPAYMAPEQARGELVDERADVYAIGAMLFQVCTGEKTPPTDVYKLHHSLGKSGVDVDLVSIVRKACAPEAGGRYRDAGKLAADLRSFTAGARVLARHYSAGALVSHWVKRHKRLAAAVAVMVVTLGVVGGVAFARVKEERDRAEKALIASREAGVREEEARKAAETERDAARAAQVRELLVRDPSQAASLAATLPAGTSNELLRARTTARVTALRTAKVPGGSFQDASLSVDEKLLLLRTSDGRALEYKIETGDLIEIDHNLSENVPLTRSTDGWVYARLRGHDIEVVNAQRSVSLRGGVEPATLASIGDHAVVMSSEGRLLGLGSLTSLLPDAVRQLGFDAADLYACSAKGTLFKITLEKAMSLGRCATRSKFDAPSVAGSFVAYRLDANTTVVIDSAGNRISQFPSTTEYKVSRTGYAVGITEENDAVLVPPGTSARQGIQIIPGKAPPVTIAVSEDFAVWTRVDGTMDVVHLRSGTQHRVNTGPNPVYRVFISTKYLVTVSKADIRLWDLPLQKRAVFSLPCVPKRLRPQTSSTIVGVECASGLALAVDAASGTTIELHRHRSAILGSTWIGSQYCTGGWDGQVICSNAITREQVHLADTPDPIQWLDGSGDYVAYVTRTGSVFRRQGLRRTAELVATTRGGGGRVAMGEGGTLAFSSLEGEVGVQQPGSAVDYKPDFGRLAGLAVFREGVVAATKTGTITFGGAVEHRTLWKANSGRVTAFSAVSPQAWAVVIDKSKVAASQGEVVHVFDETAIESVAVSPDSHRLALVVDGDIVILDMRTWKASSVATNDRATGVVWLNPELVWAWSGLDVHPANIKEL